MPIIEKVITFCQCCKCGYEWQPRHLNLKEVTQCPNCHTIYWDEPKVPAWQRKEGNKR